MIAIRTMFLHAARPTIIRLLCAGIKYKKAAAGVYALPDGSGGYKKSRVAVPLSHQVLHLLKNLKLRTGVCLFTILKMLFLFSLHVHDTT